MLAHRLTEPDAKMMAQQIVESSHRISDMITALRTFAEPTQPHIQPIDLQRMLEQVLNEVRLRYEAPPPIKITFVQPLPPVRIDPAQIGRAVLELLRNAIESEGCGHIELRVQIETADDRLRIQVKDDGSGLTQHALAHAFDPFFSSKPAGRQPGLGLSQARRLVEAHGGHITLENNRTGGAIATIWLDHWRGDAEQRQVA
jgi:signal transduction histidine kinase